MFLTKLKVYDFKIFSRPHTGSGFVADEFHSCAVKGLALCKPKNCKVQWLLVEVRLFLEMHIFSWTFILLHIPALFWGHPLHPIEANCCKTIKIQEQIGMNLKKLRLTWDEDSVELNWSRLPSSPIHVFVLSLSTYEHLAQTITKCISAQWLGKRRRGMDCIGGFIAYQPSTDGTGRLRHPQGSWKRQGPKGFRNESYVGKQTSHIISYHLMFLLTSA